jgi:UDP-glucose 4-epimerase
MGVLVTGGAGYIGSAASFVRGDVGDEDEVMKAIRESGADAIFHFAGSIVVPDLVRDPLGYYLNNTCKSRTLIERAIRQGWSISSFPRRPQSMACPKRIQ